MFDADKILLVRLLLRGAGIEVASMEGYSLVIASDFLFDDLFCLRPELHSLDCKLDEPPSAASDDMEDISFRATEFEDAEASSTGALEINVPNGVGWTAYKAEEAFASCGAGRVAVVAVVAVLFVGGVLVVVIVVEEESFTN